MKVLALLTMLAALAIAPTANAGWLYLVPDYTWFGYRDRAGVVHAAQADAARYNNVTRDYQVQIGGRWYSVGRDVDRLTDCD